MKAQEAENWTYLHAKMRDEGFHYCFKEYSSFEEIEDEQFHQLRKKYLETSNTLELILFIPIIMTLMAKKVNL